MAELSRSSPSEPGHWETPVGDFGEQFEPVWVPDQPTPLPIPQQTVAPISEADAEMVAQEAARENVANEPGGDTGYLFTSTPEAQAATIEARAAEARGQHGR